MTLLPLLFSLLCFAKTDSCANDCRIEKKENGIHFVACQCTGKSKPWNSHSKEIFFRSRLMGANPEEIQAIQENKCVAAPTFSPEEEAKVRPLATRPLCECVSSRVSAGIEMNCKKSATGEKLCLPRHTDKGGKARKPTLFDYQSCVVDRVNYRKPESCQEAVCPKEKPACPAGKELMNIADPEACCPVFVCRTGA
jgi:hypothetical protein